MLESLVLNDYICGVIAMVISAAVIITTFGLVGYRYYKVAIRKDKVNVIVPTVEVELAGVDTVFACDREPINILENYSNNGIFPMGARPTFEVLPIEQQYERAKKLRYVKRVNKNVEKATITLGDKGTYDILIQPKPKAFRNNRGKSSIANPYIHPEDHRLCLGNSVSLYGNAYIEGNKFECLKIMQEVLKSEPDGTQQIYRKWSDC